MDDLGQYDEMSPLGKKEWAAIAEYVTKECSDVVPRTWEKMSKEHIMRVIDKVAKVSKATAFSTRMIVNPETLEKIRRVDPDLANNPAWTTSQMAPKGVIFPAKFPDCPAYILNAEDFLS